MRLRRDHLQTSCPHYKAYTLLDPQCQRICLSHTTRICYLLGSYLWHTPDTTKMQHCYCCLLASDMQKFVLTHKICTLLLL